MVEPAHTAPRGARSRSSGGATRNERPAPHVKFASRPQDASPEKHQGGRPKQKLRATTVDDEGLFCSLDFLKSMPYAVWKLGKDNLVEQGHFAQGKFWKHPWQLYYVWDSKINPSKPLVLVSNQAAEDFVLNLRLKFPQYRLPFALECGVAGATINLAKQKDTMLYPQYLGAASSTEDFTALKQNAQPTGSSSLPPHMELLMTERIAQALDSHKAAKGKAKQKSAEERGRTGLENMQAMQRYLGLLDSVNSDKVIDHKTDVQSTLPPPFRSLSEPVLISVDVEAYEHNPSIITEVGFATLDTRDIIGIAPGPMGVNWQKHIRGRHLRVLEYSNFRNSRFVSGCPEQFKFGTSEFVAGPNVAQAVASCFRHPFSRAEAKLPSAPSNSNDSGFPAPKATVVFPTPDEGHVRRHTTGVEQQQQPDERRNIVLVGHSTQTDITYLRKLGYDVHNLSTLLNPIIDTARLWSNVSGEANSMSLGKLCAEVDIEPWYLHNAGNDAWYTLACGLGLAVGDAAGVKFGGKAKAAAAAATGASTAATAAPSPAHASVATPAAATPAADGVRHMSGFVKVLSWNPEPTAALPEEEKEQEKSEHEEDLMTFSDTERL